MHYCLAALKFCDEHLFCRTEDGASRWPMRGQFAGKRRAPGHAALCLALKRLLRGQGKTTKLTIS
eukprot:6998226-Prymnesium_polylepis.1